MIRRVPVSASFALAATLICKAEQAPLQLRTLATSSNTATTVPAFGFYDFAKSDSDGNMYVHPSEGYAQAAVLRIAVSSSEPTLYALPVDLRDKFNLLDFAVTARGSVW